MGKQSVFILFFFLNLLIHNAYAYNLKQVADKESIPKVYFLHTYMILIY